MSFFGIKVKTAPVNLEEDAFLLLMELFTLAKNGKPYRHLLPTLKDRAEKFPRVALLVKSLAENLEAGLPRSRR